MIVGIDLGTTNSLIGVWRDGRALLIPNAFGQLLTPSAVSIGDDGSLLVGETASSRLATHPTRSAATFKRNMGTAREFTLGSHSFRAEELSAFVLRSLKTDAEAYLGERVTEAIITVPAYFNEAQRKATKTAGELAGLKVSRLLTEPTAAALAYGLDRPTTDEVVLVVDLGGGTFDVSLLHLFEGITEVRATAGDTWLGGEDFAHVIAQAFMNNVGTAAKLPSAPESAFQAILRDRAEAVKCQLTDAEHATLSLDYQGKTFVHEFTRADFERLSEPLLARLRFPIERALRDARIDPDRVSSVILAGGATRMPVFRKLIARIFRRLPVQSIHPDEVVAQGAAVRAGMLMRDVDLVERVMTDVAPFTLGIRIGKTLPDGKRMENLFGPIIDRNTVIPASRVKRFVTAYDNQTAIDVSVFQGESQFVEENIKLGDLEMPVPAGPKGSQEIDVRFTYDPSGLLEVESVAISTGVTRTLVIEGNANVLSKAEIANRLAAMERLKVHPRDETENRNLLARAKRMYEERLGYERDAIGEVLVTFHAALDAQDPDAIRIARNTLVTVLSRLEGKPLF